MKYSDWSIRKKIAVPALVTFILGTLAIIITMAQLKSNTLELAGIKTAESVANEIVAVRGFYTKEIVKKGKENGMKFDFDYSEHADTFPLPATLVNSLGEDIAEQFPGMSIKLYSNYPFSHKQASRLDEFQATALKTLEGNPEEPVWAITKIGNKRSIRYVVPDIMKQACVGCHNSHPASVKRDWKVGDVRGAVEVIVPLEHVDVTLFSGFIKVFAVIVLIFAVLIGVVLYLVKKYVTAQVSKLSSAFKKVAQGDLSVRAEITSTDEVGQMGVEFNNMISTFHDVVQDIRSTSGQLASSSEELSATSVLIAEGTKDQSSRASQVSTAAQQMSATLIEVVRNITEASDAAKGASESALKGGDMVMSTVDSMNVLADTAKESSEIIASLGSKSDQIGDIINVINDIADQTNLLALNAAIEAARAGEQGRGFAVVADEVRLLAEKTMNATKEIGSMIDGMQEETNKAIASVEKEVRAVESGVKLANDAGGSISDIVTRVDEVNKMIEQISAASEEQSATTDQISSDIDSVATVANETVSSTEEISSASQDIARLASGLQSKVERFQISGERSEVMEFKKNSKVVGGTNKRARRVK